MTPWLDEDEVRAAAARLDLVQPTDVPSGWQMTSLDVDQRSEEGGTAPEPGCAVLDLRWEEPIADDASEEEYEDLDWLSLELLARECAAQIDVPDAVGPDGPISMPSFDVERQIGDTVVRSSSSLADQELAEIMSSLEPVDVETLIAAAAARQP